MGTLFRVALEKDDSVFHSPQDLTIQAVPGTPYEAMAWPFVPKQSYKAPWNRKGHKGPADLVAPCSTPVEDMPLPVLLPAASTPAEAKPDAAKKVIQEAPVTKPGCGGCFGTVSKRN